MTKNNKFSSSRRFDEILSIPAEIDLDASSIESSEDWENSVNSSELDVQYQSDEERAENEVIGAESIFDLYSVFTTVVILLFYYFYFYSILLYYSMITISLVFLLNNRIVGRSGYVAKITLRFLVIEGLMFGF